MMGSPMGGSMGSGLGAPPATKLPVAQFMGNGSQTAFNLPFPATLPRSLVPAGAVALLPLTHDASDKSGNGNAGTLAGPVAFNRPAGGGLPSAAGFPCLYFPGTSGQGLTLPSALFPTSSTFTIECYFAWDGVTAGWLFCAQTGSLQISLSSSNLLVSLMGSSTLISAAVSPGVMHHLRLSSAAAAVTLYLDGASAGTCSQDFSAAGATIHVGDTAFAQTLPRMWLSNYSVYLGRALGAPTLAPTEPVGSSPMCVTVNGTVTRDYWADGYTLNFLGAPAPGAVIKAFPLF